MIVPRSLRVFAIGSLVCQMLSVGFGASRAAAQNGEKLAKQQSTDQEFFRPSPASAVSRAIRLQQRAIRKESRSKSLLPDLPIPSVGLRREQSEDGVIELTNRRRPTRLIAEPLGKETVHKLELQKVLEESSVVVPLMPMPRIAAIPDGAPKPPDPGDGDLGLDIALAALVALGLGFLGISAWQRSQQV